MTKKPIIFIASDHGGFKHKEYLKKELESLGYEVHDLGPDGLQPSDDYPDYAYPVAEAVASDDRALGILICRSGQGVCVVANKVRGIQAALAWNEEVARAGRRDDHVNVLCLAADYTTPEESKKIVQAFLSEEPGRDERFTRRLEKIRSLEEAQGKI